MLEYLFSGSKQEMKACKFCTKHQIHPSEAATRCCAISRALAQSPVRFRIDVRQETSGTRNGGLVLVSQQTPARAPNGASGPFWNHTGCSATGPSEARLHEHSNGCFCKNLIVKIGQIEQQKK